MQVRILQSILLSHMDRSCMRPPDRGTLASRLHKLLLACMEVHPDLRGSMQQRQQQRSWCQAKQSSGPQGSPGGDPLGHPQAWQATAPI